ncbi:MAG: radical SAM protein [Elusimicrobiota bacterium]
MSESRDASAPFSQRRALRAIVPSTKMGEVVHLCWMLHNVCNYRCSYCDECLWGGSDRLLKFEHAERFLAQLFSAHRRNLFHVSFTGGEPTLWPDFLRLCRFLKERRCEIGMTTNGSKPLRFWDEAGDYFNWICLSYHPEFVKDDHFLGVVRLLSTRVKLAVRLMLHPEPKYWTKSLEFAGKLKAASVPGSVYVEHVPILADFVGRSRPVEYGPRQREALSACLPFVVGGSESSPRKTALPELWEYEVVYEDESRGMCRPNELVLQDLVNFNGWTCFAGVDMFFADHRGDLYRGGCQIGGKFGNIADETVLFPTSPVVCTKDFCPCGTDILVKKFRPAAPEAR